MIKMIPSFIKIKTTMTINVAILEDDETFRDAFKAHCKKSTRLNCVFTFDQTEKLIKYFSFDSAIDVIIIDLGLPGLDGFEAIKHVKKISPYTEIIVLTVYEDYNSTFKALKNGAVGYLVKRLSFKAIENHIIELKDKGAIPLSPQIARRILQYFRPPSQNTTIKEEDIYLTPKELLVVKHLTNSKTYIETAELMGISISGVRFHVKNIYKKLHVKSKIELLNLHQKGFFKKYF